MFSKGQKNQPDKANEPKSDNIYSGLLRGVEGRKHGENYMPHGYFAAPEDFKPLLFQKGQGENFLGIVHGTTTPHEREDGRIEYKTTGGIAVGSKDDRHRTVIAGSRSGKGRSVIVPELLTYDGSMIVIDPKGENAAITARYRANTLKQRVCIIDPFKATPPHCELYRKQFNPLSLVNMESMTAIEDAGLIADALVVSNNPKDAHWDESAKAFIEGVILYVACGDFSESERNLLTVGELIAGKRHERTDDLLEDMISVGGPDDRVAAAAKRQRERSKDEGGSVLSTAGRNLKFLDYDAMYSALSAHDFELEDLKNEPMTIYLVLPTRYTATCKQLLRIFVNLTLAAVEKNPAKPKLPVQMILDEMATLGYMRELENAIGQVAGLGMRITSILQDLGQLKSIYKDRFETFLGNSGILQFFGNADYFTSEWVSKYLGKTTIRVSEKNQQPIKGKLDGNSGLNFRNQTVDLMTPEEVRRFFARDDKLNRQLVCIPGKRPLVMQRANYDQHEIFQGRFDEWR